MVNATLRLIILPTPDLVQQQNSICPNKGDGVGMLERWLSVFWEIDLTSGYITEIVARRSGDLQAQNFMRPWARLLICAMWLPEAHKFDTPDPNHHIIIWRVLGSHMNQQT